MANLAVVEVKVVEAGGRSRTSHLVVTAFTGLFSRFCGGVILGTRKGQCGGAEMDVKVEVGVQYLGRNRYLAELPSCPCSPEPRPCGAV